MTVQKPVSEADQAFLRGFAQVREVSTHLADFADTAVLLANLDLLVSAEAAGMGAVVGRIVAALGREAG